MSEGQIPPERDELMESLDIVIEYGVDLVRRGEDAKLQAKLMETGLPMALYQAIRDFEKGAICVEEVRRRYFESVRARNAS